MKLPDYHAVRLAALTLDRFRALSCFRAAQFILLHWSRLRFSQVAAIAANSVFLRALTSGVDTAALLAHWSFGRIRYVSKTKFRAQCIRESAANRQPLRFH